MAPLHPIAAAMAGLRDFSAFTSAMLTHVGGVVKRHMGAARREGASGRTTRNVRKAPRVEGSRPSHRLRPRGRRPPVTPNVQELRTRPFGPKITDLGRLAAGRRRR